MLGRVRLLRRRYYDTRLSLCALTRERRGRAFRSKQKGYTFVGRTQTGVDEQEDTISAVLRGERACACLFICVRLSRCSVVCSSENIYVHTSTRHATCKLTLERPTTHRRAGPRGYLARSPVCAMWQWRSRGHGVAAPRFHVSRAVPRF